MTMRVSRTLCLGVLPLATMLARCSKDEPAAARSAPPTATAPAATPSAGQRRFELASGTATFLIDAPLEKIKGRATKVRGNLDVDPSDLKTGKGQIEIDLDDLHTETFGDAEKDTSQTGHAKNWFEIGPDVEAKRREENRWVRFTIKTIDDANPTKLAAAEAKNGQRTVTVQATGDLWLHGVASSKKVGVALTLDGPPEAPTSVRIVTSQPLKLSLKEHDVKPRDLAGKFVSGALEKIGQKIDDTVQITLDLTAKAK
ncbi:MAG TPA: YceI family protein [Polyangiaceae bacterium]|jgi:polyisoprenoid-binding protein YceI|nr:YceI family protein [Polyangiaceae bacterium]